MGGWGGALPVAAGVVVLAAVLLDILVTSLHPSVQSPLSGRFYRVLWRLVSALARRLPARPRRQVLSWMLPASIAGLLVVWLLLLLCGFALLYMPGMGQAGAFRSPEPLGWADALYFSGSCLTSIGFGDIVPGSGILRAVAVAEGLCGLLVIGVAVTYVLAVYPALPTVRVLASTLNEETDGRVDAVSLVRRYLSVGATEALAARCRELANQVTVLTEAHVTHPVLFYAHPQRAESSFLRALLLIQRLVGLLRYGLRAEEHPSLVRDPRVVGLEESLIAALRLMGTSLHLDVRGSGSGEEAQRRLAGEHAALVERLRQAGLRAATTVTAVERRAFVRFRLVTDPYIEAYWANSGYQADEVWGDRPPLRGLTAPLPEEDAGDEAEDLNE